MAPSSDFPPSANGDPSQKKQRRGETLTVSDLHLVGRGSPLHSVAAVHGEGVRFAEKSAANERQRGREDTPTAPPAPHGPHGGLGKLPGAARGRGGAEQLRDPGGSSRLTKPSRGSCAGRTRRRLGDTQREPALREAWGTQASCSQAKTSPSPRLSALRRGGGSGGSIPAQAAALCPCERFFWPLFLFAGLVGGQRVPANFEGLTQLWTSSTSAGGPFAAPQYGITAPVSVLPEAFIP